MTAAPNPDEGFTPYQEADNLGASDDGAAADDKWMTRAEEHLHVTTQRVPITRVRLRKQIVTEMQAITVPVSREEIVIDYEPIADTDGAGRALPTTDEQNLEIVLYAQRPAVIMETVAVERIRVSTKSVTEDQTITEPIGKEQVERHEDPLEVAPAAWGEDAGPYELGTAPGTDHYTQP